MSEDTVIDDSSQAFRDFARIYFDDDFHDVIFLVENKRVAANKLMISTKSEYWRMFFMENKQKTIVVEEVNVAVFEKIVAYMHTGKIVITSILEAADLQVLTARYNLRDLNEDLNVFISRSLNWDNVWVLFYTKNGTKQMINICLDFLASDFQRTVIHPSFNFLRKQELIALISRNSTDTSTLIMAIIFWLESHKNVDPIELMEHMKLTTLTEVQITWIANNVDRTDEQKLRALITKQKQLQNSEREVKRRGIKSIHAFFSPLFDDMSIPYLRLIYDEEKDSLEFPMELQYEEIFLLYQNLTVLFKFKKNEVINHCKINLRLSGKIIGEFCFYIEVTMDNEKWTRIIDRSVDCVTGNQILYFADVEVQAIRIVGINYSNGEKDFFYSWIDYVKDFESRHFKFFYKPRPHPAINNIMCPGYNIISSTFDAVMFVGNVRVSHLKKNILNYHLTLEMKKENPCKVEISDNKAKNFIDIALSQPFYLSEIVLRLPEKGRYTYNLYTWYNHDEVYFDIKEERLAKRHPPYSKQWNLIARCENTNSLKVIKFERQVVSVISVECVEAMDTECGRNTFQLIEIYNRSGNEYNCTTQ
ncbi:hypothetical protein B4U80_12890 [Leptotrombidium deliense]|uniref:BTB domain-containing protein n=1 Tax=Leptotrombidium deliense TaxID=299467 RepID=A0A443SHZ1_9ACAR|nr:hypothetical protein B4U80_12890 [Leptotrombidium deliense]